MATGTKTAAPRAGAASASGSGEPVEPSPRKKPSTLGQGSTPSAKSPSQIYSGIPGDAKGTIVFAVILTSGSALLAQAIHKKSLSPRPYIRIILGGFLMGLGLTVISQANANVAKALAWVTALSAILINGQTLFSVAGDVVSNKSPVTVSGASGSTGFLGGNVASGSFGSAVGGLTKTVGGLMNKPQPIPPHVSEHGG